jgi:hypothetical protein
MTDKFESKFINLGWSNVMPTEGRARRAQQVLKHSFSEYESMKGLDVTEQLHT